MLLESLLKEGKQEEKEVQKNKTEDKRNQEGGQEKIQKKKKKQEEQDSQSLIKEVDSQPQPLHGFPIKAIYSIDFCDDAVLVACKSGLVVYSFQTHKKILSIERNIWEAAFIVGTGYITYVETQNLQMLWIVQISSRKTVAAPRVNFEIQKIRTSRGCIAMYSLSKKQLYVIHYPSLRPILNHPIGCSLRAVFDISYEGTKKIQQVSQDLCRSHHCPRHSLNSNSEVNKMIRTRSSMFLKAHIRKITSHISQDQGQAQQKNQKIEVTIKAHKQAVRAIKLSPVGRRLATASNKGSLIRIFDCATGTNVTELRMSYELLRIMDIVFNPDGNCLAALNEKNMVNLFNCKMDEYELAYKKHKKGYKIYQQENPHSMFYFLGFLSTSLGNQLPFANCTLVNPDYLEVEGQMHNQLIRRQSESKSEKTEEQALTLTDKGIVQPSEAAMESPKRMQSSMQNFGSRRYSKPNPPKAKPRMYNTIGKVHLSSDYCVWVAKGSYVYKLKYDPFNGGQMATVMHFKLE